MTLLTNDRAQALQVGAVLLFGILVILFAVWQAFVIPEQNSEIEFNHNQDVQDQMLELHGTVMATTDSDTPQSTSVKLGTDFPSRLMFVNPSASTGTLETTDPTDVTIANANALDLDGEPFWDGSERAYTTRGIEYNADYRLFDGAPRTVYDSGVLYNAFGSQAAASPRSDQSVIRGNTISLTMVDGEYWETGSRTIEPSFDPVSTQTETVRVESDGEPITITLQSEMGADTWENEILADEENVVEVRDNGDGIEIVLDEDETYNLKLSKVGLGNNVDSPAPAYLNEVSGGGEQVIRGEPHTITIDVRDKYNNPMSGIEVEGTVMNDAGSFFSAEDDPQNLQLKTNSDGQAHFQFRPSSIGDIDIEFEATDSDAFIQDGVDSIEVELNSIRSESGNLTDGDGIANLNPPDIRLIEAGIIGGNSDDVGLAFERIDEGDEPLTLTEFRVSFIDLPQAQAPQPVEYKYRYDPTDFETDFHEIPSRWLTVDGPTLDQRMGNSTDTDDNIILEFDDIDDRSAIIMSSLWEGDETAITRTYYFAVGSDFEGFENGNGGNGDNGDNGENGGEIYEIEDVTLSEGQGSSIAVDIEIETDDENAEVRVTDDTGNEETRDADDLDDIEIGNQNQVNDITVELLDGSGNTQAEMTVPWEG